MKTLKNDRYTYRVTWSSEDNEYIGFCAEFPSLSWLAGTQEEALSGIRAAVAMVVEDMKSENEPVPEPFAIRHYSGHFTVRVPEEVHRRLVIEAAEANISFNRLVNARLNTGEGAVIASNTKTTAEKKNASYKSGKPSSLKVHRGRF